MKKILSVLAFLYMAHYVMGQVSCIALSGDISSMVMYLGTNVAIAKSTVIQAVHEPKTVFSIGKARWKNDPELPSDTGHWFCSVAEDNPKMIGISEDQHWIFIEGKTFDEKKDTFQSEWTVIFVSNGKFWKSNVLQDLQKKLEGQVDLSIIRSEPIEVFFDRMLIRYFSLHKPPEKI
jgi:hypothetical protein